MDPKSTSSFQLGSISATDSSSSPVREENEKSSSALDVANLTIHQVAREGDIQLMKKILDRIPNPQLRKKKINARDEERLTPLHYAAKYNQYCMLVFLVENGADVQRKAEDSGTALHYLAKYRKKGGSTFNCEIMNNNNSDIPVKKDTKYCIKLLVDNGADVNARDALGSTPLHLACTKKNIQMVQNLLDFQTLELEAADNQGITALHIACMSGRTEILKLLLEAGANLRSSDKDLSTPFHLTCAEGTTEAAQMLLDKADELSRTSLEEDVFYTIVNENSKPNQDKDFYSKSTSKSALDTISRLRTPDMKRKTTATSVGMLKNNGLRGAVDLIQDKDASKNLPLHLAIENGHLEMVKLCLEQGRKAGIHDMVHACRAHEDSCLHLAVNKNNLNIVKYLLHEGVDINARNSSLMTPVMVGCQQNAHQIIKYLLQKGANVELKDSDYMTPLMMACRHGHYESILCLLEHGADVTETDKDDKTCLMFAAEENRSEVVSLLLGHNAVKEMIEERDRFNNTALHLASMKGHSDVVKILLQHQAMPDTKNDADRTTLHLAALFGHDVIIPELIERDRAILNLSDEDSNAALHLAAIGGNLKSALTLVHLGANLEISNGRQWTPLDCAAAHGWEKIVSVFLDAGASIQPKGKSDVAALHLACQRGHVNVVKLLLQWKADVTFKASDGRNALDFAIDFGQKDCVMALINHETWLKSMKNAIMNPVTGQMVTPMRKLIMKMEDMAIEVCNRCISDNNKKPTNEDYAVTLNYELLDDMYSSTEWMSWDKSANSERIVDNAGLQTEETHYTVYDENDGLTSEAHTYTEVSDMLEKNHPLQIMVSYQKESLLLHPLVTGLLSYKWRLFGRYVYYTNLSIYLLYMILLNCYMLLQTPTYMMNWEKIIFFRRFLENDRNITGLNIPSYYGNSFVNDSKACWYYRSEVIETSRSYDAQVYNYTCTMQGSVVQNMGWVVLGFSVFNLIRELLQMLSRRLDYLEMTNLIELTLYVLSLIVTLDFDSYIVHDVTRLTAGNLTQSQVVPLNGFQEDTGVRQQWQEQIGAFAIFFSWMVLLLFIQKLPRLGIFVVMFADILKTFAEFFVVFALFVIAFALSFTILLGNQREFEHWHEALIKTTVMMIGELDYSTIFYSAPSAISDIGKEYHSEVYQRDISIVLFVIFLLVMTIIIMNLLVGLAVGDIIQVQENATLKRLGMQVNLALEVEFTLPKFLRKKTSKRKQQIKMNKHRKSNFIKRLFMEDFNLLKTVSKTLAETEKSQDAPKTAEDKLLNHINLLRGQLSNIQEDQEDVKKDVKGFRIMIRRTQIDSREQANEIKQNLETSSANLSVKIDSTHSGLAEKTQTESNQTRDRVQGTLSVVNELKEDLDHTKQDISQVKSGLEKKIEKLHEEILSRDWRDVESRVQSCQQRVEETRKEIMDMLTEMKVMLVAEQFMSNV